MRLHILQVWGDNSWSLNVCIASKVVLFKLQVPFFILTNFCKVVVVFTLQTKQLKLVEFRLYSQVTYPVSSWVVINTQFCLIWPSSPHLSTEVCYLNKRLFFFLIQKQHWYPFPKWRKWMYQQYDFCHSIGGFLESFWDLWKHIVHLLSCVWLFALPWNAAHQVPLSLTFSESA